MSDQENKQATEQALDNESVADTVQTFENEAEALVVGDAETDREPAETIISCTGLRKRFVEGKLDVEVLKGIDLDIKAGEKVAIIGSSGSGKSTLLHLLGGLDLPSQGEVTVMGDNMATLSDAERGTLRNQSLGFIY